MKQQTLVLQKDQHVIKITINKFALLILLMIFLHPNIFGQEKDTYNILKQFTIQSQYSNKKLLIDPVNTNTTQKYFLKICSEKGKFLTPIHQLGPTSRPDTIVSTQEWELLEQSIKNFHSIKRWHPKMLRKYEVQFKRKVRRVKHGFLSFLRKTDPYDSLKYNYILASNPFFWSDKKAIIYIEELGDIESGEGTIYIMKKNDNDEWNVIASCNMWLS